MSFIVEHWAQIATCLLVVSETIALIPALKSNSIMEAIINVLKNVGGKTPA